MSFDAQFPILIPLVRFALTLLGACFLAIGVYEAGRRLRGLAPTRATPVPRAVARIASRHAAFYPPRGRDAS